jgi:hypothetical protein
MLCLENKNIGFDERSAVGATQRVSTICHDTLLGDSPRRPHGNGKGAHMEAGTFVAWRALILVPFISFTPRDLVNAM